MTTQELKKAFGEYILSQNNCNSNLRDRLEIEYQNGQGEANQSEEDYILENAHHHEAEFKIFCQEQAEK